jgi:hypothetical protein
MNNIKRFLFGILSSALFAVGLVRSADRLDPMTRSLPESQSAIRAVASDTESECWIDVSNT